MARRRKPEAQAPKLRNESGRPLTGDGRTQGGQIRGGEIQFKTAGGSTVGTGGLLRALRWIGGGKHRGGGQS